MLSAFAIRFNVFDGTLGRTLVGNLAFIGFSQIPGGTILFWAYQILAVLLLTAASMTAFQDLQATEWRDVAIGEIPEIIVYRDPRGTFTRSVTISYILTMIIMFLVKGNTSAAIPYYGVGVFMPIMVMGFAIRKHILQNFTGRTRKWGSLWGWFCRRSIRDCVHRTDCWQMDRRRLGGVNLIQRVDPGCQCLADFPDWCTYTKANPSHCA